MLIFQFNPTLVLRLDLRNAGYSQASEIKRRLSNERERVSVNYQSSSFGAFSLKTNKQSHLSRQKEHSLRFNKNARLKVLIGH